MKKILVVDDSALMRRVVCDIINSDGRFRVEDTATNGEEALKLLQKNTYDGVVLDVNMPRMSGIELLRELNKQKISARVVMNSSTTREGAKITLEALELGAIDFIHKPLSIMDAKADKFRRRFLNILWEAVTANLPSTRRGGSLLVGQYKFRRAEDKPIVLRNSQPVTGRKLVAIACSTGGPRALQQVIPKLPGNLDAPVLVVQHMPSGFTESLAERLNTISELSVKEAEPGDKLLTGHVYIAKGGTHLKVRKGRGESRIEFSDEAPREGVKPCANYMYESLMDSEFDQIVCVVLTGMGADGTEGIMNLSKKKQIHVLAQEQSTCAVYGMPRAVSMSGLVNQVVALEDMAQQITKNVGVRRNGC
ncbi:MAG: chemotaxis-specific protein-glutamate methyltransferase CheB [Lachnospiraceae bacterium]|nr:chemotaxis-specific protein-glutamate methyltransferase CheB [Lachnospiraceae bacterium]